MKTMSDQPLVTVIVPVYNAEKYLRHCLDSILAQDVESIEVITVDDGSGDESAAILEEYHRNHGVIVVHQSNGGPSKARNTALGLARGKYVGFVDSDDWIEPNMYSTMCGAAEREGADVVFCNIYRNQDVRLRKYMPSGVYRGDGIAGNIYPILISSIRETRGEVTLRGAAWCRVFRRDMLERRGIQFDEELIYNEDGLFCVKATLAAGCYVYLGDDYLYHNYYVPGSLTKRYIPGLWERQKKMADKLREATDGIGYDFRPQIDKKLMEIAIYCVENECKADNDASAKIKLGRLRSILNDESLRASMANINPSTLKRINKAYWWAFRIRSPRAAMAIASYRRDKHKKNNNS